MAKWLVILGAGLVAGCGSVTPSSLRPGLYNTATGLPLYASERISPAQVQYVLYGPGGTAAANAALFPDYNILKFKPGLKLCRDTFQLPDLSGEHGPVGPGAVRFARDLAIDEAEITNLDWRLFVADYLPAGESVADLLPDSTALPVKDYYTNPFYAFYPVVGISYEQANLFCEWRTFEANGQLSYSSDKRTATQVLKYRLPTEAEWEAAALAQSGLPYGTNCTALPVRVAEGAAAYLQKRANSSVPAAQIKKDITAYNATHPVRFWINYAQPEPYFLALATPGYVYQGPPNDFGLYQLLGNAAEMVAERGVTKGGSYRDGLEACRIRAQGHFVGPAPTVGFRAVCQVLSKK